ncbi:hypothetical protein [Arthrobacter subterraneus]|uniref:hypothetical protein n=1 Tax=Arthrobacter subterraneus TaxID=335973 RepID=UPI00383071A2
MATGGQFYWPSVGTFVAAYGQFFMAANTAKGLASLELTKPGHRVEEGEVSDAEVIT